MQSHKARVEKELNDWKKNAESSNIEVSIVGDNIFHWKGFIQGPVWIFKRKILFMKEVFFKSTSIFLKIIHISLQRF